MECPQCHTTNPEHAIYCMRCGLRLAIFCAGCGTRLPISAAFCVACGLAVGQPPPRMARQAASGAVAPTAPQDVGGYGGVVGPSPAGHDVVTPATPAPGTGHGEPPALSLQGGGGGQAQAAPPPGAEAAQRAPVPPSAAIVPESSDPMLERLRRLMPQEYVDRLMAQQGQSAGERRLVTILFSDVKGSTAMAESLDPEDVMEIMNGAFEVLIPPIYRYEGTLARLMGDAILAFFGAPISHENDPERAVRAALEIVEGAQAYARQLAEARGIKGFNVRVGINTGLVVVGEVGSDMRMEYTAMGDAINLAARMEQNAPVGGVLISDETYKYVAGKFDIDAREPIPVKGKAEPVRVYVVRGARSRTFRTVGRGVAGITTRMVGRQAELETLRHLWERVVERGRAAVATIVGDAGVGKSRLLYEFEKVLEGSPDAADTFRARGAAELQSAPYALLRSLFTFRFQIQDNDPADIARDKLVAGLQQALGHDEHGEMQAHFIGHLLGFDFADSAHLRGVLDDAQQVRDRALIYLGAFAEAATAGGPLVMLLEDLHWADDSSLAAIERMIAAILHRPVLVLGLARPTVFERWGGWQFDDTAHTRIDLTPLSGADSATLLGEILARVDDVPETLRRMVAGTAEGNPLYIEELVNVLIESGVIVRGADPAQPWSVDATRLSELRVPPTLQGILQARLDGLPLEERTVLQRGAVVGRTFWDEAVMHISRAVTNTGHGALGGVVEGAQVAAGLVALTRRQIVSQAPEATFSGMGEYVFVHALTRDVAYESMLRRVRRLYHGWVAEWLIAQSHGREGELSGLIAEHLEAARNHLEAIRYLRYAAELAAGRYANAQAVAYYSRALALLDEAPLEETDRRELAYGLRLGREAAYHLLGQRQAQLDDLAALENLADAFDDVELRAQVALRRAAYCEATSDFPGSFAAAQQAIAWARAAEAPRQQAEGIIRCGIARWRQGALDEARTLLDEALALAEQHGNQVEAAQALLNLGTIAYFTGDPVTAQTRWKGSLATYKALGNQRRQARCLSNLVATAHGLGDMLGARAYSMEALAIYRAISDRRGESDALCNLAGMARELGDLDTARSSYEEALALYRAIGDQGGQALVLNNLALLHSDGGDHGTACHLCDEALAIEHAIGDRLGEGYSYNHLGLAHEGLGQLGDAAEAYGTALALRRELGQEGLTMDDLAGLARVALARDDIAAAVAYADEVLVWVDAHGLEGVEDPLRVLVAAATVLQAQGDTERAEAVLEQARAEVAAHAERISDPDVRNAYLASVPVPLGAAHGAQRRTGN